MAVLRSLALASAAALVLAESGNAQQSSLQEVLGIVLDQECQRDVPFREVIRLATGHRILPLHPDAEPDRAFLDIISHALEETLRRFNAPEHAVRTETRINEVSVHFEASLRELIDGHPAFTCSRPLTLSGGAQASGYPDLLIRHVPTERIAYLDPKLFQAGAESSSLRTFYYTPRLRTSKVQHDAHHLLAGIEHDGRAGAWKFTGWKLVDLHEFNVRLKAEYQASNRDIYRQSLILRSSR